ncbi:glycosyltransferase family 2 protein [Demequina maris]|uniref:glycosyltransferase family 2 protein n=1 Tax=Demequina maris TaxID=1638982 RepID=UPI000782B194|nr:glycosyltransferase family 2 protein [Demequina maris]
MNETLASSDVTVVIPTYNGADEILDSLASAAQARVARIIVVDNASTDGTAHLAATSEFACDVVRLAHNSGFGAACNEGAKRANTPLLLFLNQDARILEGLDHAVSALQENPHAGIAGAAMYSSQGGFRPSVYRFPTLPSVALKRLSLAGGHFRSGDMDSPAYEVDYVEASFLLVRSSVWRHLGGMDERYFMYGEERDFCYRARALGHKTLYVSRARYVHDGGYVASRAPLVAQGQWRFLSDHSSGARGMTLRGVFYSKLAVLRLMSTLRQMLAPNSTTAASAASRARETLHLVKETH